MGSQTRCRDGAGRSSAANNFVYHHQNATTSVELSKGLVLPVARIQRHLRQHARRVGIKAAVAAAAVLEQLLRAVMRGASAAAAAAKRTTIAPADIKAAVASDPGLSWVLAGATVTAAPAAAAASMPQKRDESFGLYIHRTLGATYAISAGALGLTNSILLDLLDKLAGEAAQLRDACGRVTMLDSDVLAATRILLQQQQLAKQALARADTALKAFERSRV